MTKSPRSMLGVKWKLRACLVTSRATGRSNGSPYGAWTRFTSSLGLWLWLTTTETGGHPLCYFSCKSRHIKSWTENVTFLRPTFILGTYWTAPRQSFIYKLKLLVYQENKQYHRWQLHNVYTSFLYVQNVD